MSEDEGPDPEGSEEEPDDDSPPSVLGFSADSFFL